MPHECSRDGTPAFGLSSCCGHLKDRLRAGERLSAEELVFVGAYEPRIPSGGWREVGNLAQYELDAPLSREDSELLAALMAVGGSDRAAFLA